MKHINSFYTDITTNLVSRRNYSKIKSNFIEPCLKGAQSDSYEQFLKHDLKAIVENFFPIFSPSGNLELQFEKLIIKKPKISEYEAWERSKTYQASVYLQLKLINHETGEVKSVKSGKNKDGDSSIFLGDIPLLTQKGTFIVNGIEKFVISQIVRAPGAYMSTKFQLKLSNSRKKVQEGLICELLPLRGILMLLYSPENQQNIRLMARTLNGDNAIQFSATVLFKALGLRHSKILDIFDHSEAIQQSLLDEKFSVDEIFDDPEIMDILEEIRIANSERELLEQHENKLDEHLYGLLYQYYQTYMPKLNAIKQQLSKLNKNDPTNITLLNDIRAIQEEARDLVEQICCEKAAKFVVNSLMLSYKIAKVPTTSYRELLWQYFFEKRMYDFGDVGRYKLNKKLLLSERLYDQVIAQDILDVHGNVVFKRGTLMQKAEIKRYKELAQENLLKIKHKITIPNVSKHFKNKKELKDLAIEKIRIFVNKEEQEQELTLIGVPASVTGHSLSISDLIAIFSYLSYIEHGIGKFDYIDHLGNKRLRLISELLGNRLQVALIRIEKFVREKMTNIEMRMNSTAHDVENERSTIKSLINTKPFQMIIKEFFNSHQLTQFIDQQNPLSELTNKRRISAMGPGGTNREDPNLDVRDVHYSHYGRICPIETPEGMNIGLIMSLATYSQIDKHGFITSPYFKVVDGRVTDQIDWLTSIREDDYVITQSMSPMDQDGNLISPVEARFNSVIEKFDAKEVDYIDVSPRQVVSIATGSIPFLENDDANRALMGANMQRQATPLLKPHAPIVGTGLEYKIAKESGMALVAERDGTIVDVDSSHITIKYDDAHANKVLPLVKFKRSNQDTCNNQTPIVTLNQRVSAGQTLVDGPAMHNGELALGQNVLVALTTWSGYNYEDAIILSSRLVHDDIYTSVHFDEYVAECIRTKNGDEEITRQVPNVSDDAKAYLDDEGIIMVGAKVVEGDILVGKTSPKSQTDYSPEDKLLHAVFGEKSKQVRDTSLKVPHGGEGVVAAVKRFSIKDQDDLNDDVIEIIKVFVAQKRKIQIGDKMAGRHGNKGIVSKIVPIEDMPFLADGTPIDIMLNPLGVPSRMNIGQVLEMHLGLAAYKLALKQLVQFHFENTSIDQVCYTFGLKPNQAQILMKHLAQFLQEQQITDYEVANSQLSEIHLSIILNRAGLTRESLGFKVCTPVFSGVNQTDLLNIMEEAGVDVRQNHAKFDLFDGRTGEKFEKPISVGIMYMLKLDHMVDDKIHARAVGPYSKITQQPLGGKSQNGGQRFGEMEVWALEAYGAAYNLRELLTVKSDDLQARNLLYSSIIKNKKYPSPGLPESFKILVKKLEGLCFQINVSYYENDQIISTDNFFTSTQHYQDEVGEIDVHEPRFNTELSDEINALLYEEELQAMTQTMQPPQTDGVHQEMVDDSKMHETEFDLDLEAFANLEDE